MLTRLSKPPGRSATDLDVEEELHFHVELLRQDYLRRGMSPQEAGDATLRRFGDIGSVKKECVEIRRRSRRLMRALKSFLAMILVAGVLARVLSADFHVVKVGELLIAVAVLGRLLLHARSLSQANYPSTKRNIFASDGY